MQVSLIAMDKLLQERLSNLKPIKGDVKLVKNANMLDSLFQVDGYKLLT